MIQTGDPKGAFALVSERIWKDKDNPKIQVLVLRMSTSYLLQIFRGALAMANSGPNTNGSQFYINQNKDDIWQTPNCFPAKIIDAYKNGGNPTRCSGNYTVFGQVIDGMDVVDKIASHETGW